MAYKKSKYPYNLKEKITFKEVKMGKKEDKACDAEIAALAEAGKKIGLEISEETSVVKIVEVVKNCASCRFWEQKGFYTEERIEMSMTFDYGCCHKNAPLPKMIKAVDKGTCFITIWPETKSNDFCSEHRYSKE